MRQRAQCHRQLKLRLYCSVTRPQCLQCLHISVICVVFGLILVELRLILQLLQIKLRINIRICNACKRFMKALDRQIICTHGLFQPGKADILRVLHGRCGVNTLSLQRVQRHVDCGRRAKPGHAGYTECAGLRGQCQAQRASQQRAALISFHGCIVSSQQPSRQSIGSSC